MDMTNSSPNLELEAILRTLASLPKPQNTLSQHPQPTHIPVQSQSSSQDEPYKSLPEPSAVHHAPSDPRLADRPAQRQPPPPVPQARPSTPTIDPATIIEWKQGLRCVVKVAAQNPEFAASIRKLMKDQEQNVSSWKNGRARLIEEQNLRRENEQMHRAALSLPGLLENSPLLCTPERDQEEMSRYDQKVYRASKSMVDSQSSSLKVLGVPFFGTKPFLILHDDEVPLSDVSESRAQDLNGRKISAKQLLILQRKMLNHLLELYGD